MVKKALLLGTLITLGTGVWGYKLSYSLLVEESVSKLHGLPFPYLKQVNLTKYDYDLGAFLVDFVIWSLLSLLILFLLRKRKS